MANGYFERGEIYWIRMDNGFGGEQGVGRPGLILTENSINNKCSTVTIAFLSKQNHPSNPFYLPVDATGITSYVILNQIMTYDKVRVGKYLGMLNSAEQKMVDDALEDVFDLGYVDDALVKEKESEIADRDAVIGDLRAEVAGVKAAADKKDAEIASLKMEIEMWQKCYGRCMDMLVETKVAADVSRRVVVEAPVVKVEPVVSVEPVKLPEPPVEQPVAEVKLDINSCTATALKKIGFSLALARKIVEGRPYTSVEDLKRINGLKATQYRIMESKLCCIPVKVEEPAVVEDPVVTEPVAEERDPGFEKLNLNTVSAKELSEATGLALTQAYAITAYRKRNGMFSCVDDLLKVRNIFPGTIKKFRHMVEV